jgi:hypothetical protein
LEPQGTRGARGGGAGRAGARGRGRERAQAQCEVAGAAGARGRQARRPLGVMCSGGLQGLPGWGALPARGRARGGLREAACGPGARGACVVVGINQLVKSGQTRLCMVESEAPPLWQGAGRCAKARSAGRRAGLPAGLAAHRRARRSVQCSAAVVGWSGPPGGAARGAARAGAGAVMLLPGGVPWGLWWEGAAGGGGPARRTRRGVSSLKDARARTEQRLTGRRCRWRCTWEGGEGGGGGRAGRKGARPADAAITVARTTASAPATALAAAVACAPPPPPPPELTCTPRRRGRAGTCRRWRQGWWGPSAAA